MSTKGKASGEFLRYRQVLAAIYVAAAAAAFLLLSASVVRDLFFRKPSVDLPQSAITASNPSPKELLKCNSLVLEQLTALSAQANQLLQSPLSGDSQAIASDWKNFSTNWQDQWDIIDARCRFSELADTDMGRAYDRMAHVHDALPAMRLKFNSLLAMFDREQADQLAEMRRALENSRNSISERVTPQRDSESIPDSKAGSAR